MTMRSIVDAQGRMIELCIMQDDTGNLVGYALREGEQPVAYLNDAMTVTNGARHPPLKPRWVDGAWTEEATPEELEAAYPPVQRQADPVAERLDALESLTVDTQYQLALTQLGLTGEV